MLLLAAVDSFREPENQVTGYLYVEAVGLYQALRGDWLGDHIRCRYRPSCSRYSQEAVRAHGIRQGLLLTVKRVLSCRKSVPPGTPDPVPSPERATGTH